MANTLLQSDFREDDTLDAGIRRHEWTAEEVYRAMAAGVFGARPVDRLKMELIEGELIEKMPQNRPHSAALAIAASVLASTFGMGHYMAQQVPLHIDTKSEPEPDVMVVSGSPETTRVIPMAKIPV